MSIHLAQTDADIDACWPVMAQLRPHIARADFLPRVRRQQAAGYQLAALSNAGRVVAVAGFRYGEILAWGRHMYVDDLITDEAVRSHGHGERLFAWLVEQARAHGCEQLHLDSGVQRFGAHRFYLRQRMDITSHHFALKLHGTAAP
jgi:GNAT superfamily N-acetyltransferase